MAIEELKEERRLRVPTRENPYYATAAGCIVKFISADERIYVEHPDPRDYDDGCIYRGLRFDSPTLKPVRLTFKPCEPEYEQVELKLPFVRRWDNGCIIVFFAMEGDLFRGYWIGGGATFGFNQPHSRETILARSTPVRITGPTRKAAEVQYPAVYRALDGHEWRARDQRAAICVDPSTTEFGDFVYTDGAGHFANKYDFTLITDDPRFPQPQGEWELPFAALNTGGERVAVHGITEDNTIVGVIVDGARAGESHRWYCGAPEHLPPTTIG